MKSIKVFSSVLLFAGSLAFITTISNCSADDSTGPSQYEILSANVMEGSNPLTFEVNNFKVETDLPFREYSVNRAFVNAAEDNFQYRFFDNTQEYASVIWPRDFNTHKSVYAYGTQADAKIQIMNDEMHNGRGYRVINMCDGLQELDLIDEQGKFIKKLHYIGNSTYEPSDTLFSFMTSTTSDVNLSLRKTSDSTILQTPIGLTLENDDFATVCIYGDTLYPSQMIVWE